MIKDLVIPITNTAGDANALAAAIVLAARENAHLAVLEIANLPLPAPGSWGLIPEAMGDIYTKLRAQAESNATVLRERLSRESISSEVRVTEAFLAEPPEIAALHARYSDLTVMTGATEGVHDAPIIQAFFSALLLEAGRPLLVVPPSFISQRPAKHVVVAWQSTREASRALHDAMPLLHSAESVDVLEIVPVSGEAGDGPQPGADIATHLARHGLKVRVVVHQRRDESVALALMRHAQDSGAELLVAGGYGHSRFREWVLGGVTRELLMVGGSSLPILFSH